MTIPDFPGCFSAADNWQDLPCMMQEAIELWCEGQDLELPQPSDLEALATNPDYTGHVVIDQYRHRKAGNQSRTAY